MFEVLGVDKVLGYGEFSDVDVDIVCDMLVEVSWLVEGLVVELFVEGDCNLFVFDLKIYLVMLLELFKKLVNVMLEVGWDKVGIDEVFGGMLMFKVVVWVLYEYILGVNLVVWMYVGGVGFV